MNTMNTSWRRLRAAILATLALLLGGPALAQFDHGFATWDGLVKKNVKWLPDGKQSRVDYGGFQKDRASLRQVLDAMSAVELILTQYPDLQSIKDLGSLFQSPWKKKFFRLLGDERHLDWIEHEQLRPNYADPRVHAAVNCASIGCPALRDEAFTAPKLEAQLDDGMLRFMGDRTRNRVKNGRLEVSSIFKWFREDWEKGHKGYSKIEDLFARYALQLSDDPAEQARLKAGKVEVTHLDYDWSLNVSGR